MLCWWAEPPPHRMSVIGFSRDADHVLPDLRERFDLVLAQLESVSGWTTARVRPPVLILGSLDGIETGVRQLIRSQPLETTVIKLDRHRTDTFMSDYAALIRPTRSVSRLGEEHTT